MTDRESTDEDRPADEGDQEAEEKAPLSDLAEDLPTDQRGSGPTDRAPESEAEDASSMGATGDGDSSTMETASGEGALPSERTGSEDAPLEEMADDVRKRRQRREAESESDPFEEMDVGPVDGEEIWEELLTDEEMSEAERAVGAGVTATEVGSAAPGERAEHVVPKDQFCSRCPYLTDPPGLACDHDGTEIVEVTDSEHFRVRGCPFTGRAEQELTEFE